MDWTPEQRAIIEHPPHAHALVRAAPGSGKTATLVGRVTHLWERGEAGRARAVMFNKAIQETFAMRLEGAGISGVKATTFDALGLEVLHAAQRRGLLSRPLEVTAFRTRDWSQAVHRNHARAIESADDIATSVTFWKAHLVPPTRAACEDHPEIVEAYREFETLRGTGPTLQVDFADMVYTAVGVLRKHPRLLGQIDHFLVDEFQDVNPARVELLRLLMHETTTLMAVGDADQAIYEFSGAHPRFFSDFTEFFPALPTTTYPLSRSFRFGPKIASAARALIANNEDRFPLEVVGCAEHEGLIERIEDVPAIVQRLLADGHPAREIAVLYRGRIQCVAVLAELAARRIPMETEDIDRLRKGRGPELALAYLRFATSDAPVNFDDAWAIAYAPDRYIRKEGFAKQVRQLGRRGLRAVLGNTQAAKAAEQPRSAIEAMNHLANLLSHMAWCPTAGEALDLLINETDIPAQLAGRKRSDTEQEQAVAAFEAVHVLLKGLKVPPGDAARALAELDPRAGHPADQCVWVSTIHKAKGKEWRSVLLPKLVEGMCPAGRHGQVLAAIDSPNDLEQSDWIEQERRIFYVGLTRASEAVFLEVPSRGASSFLAEIEPPRPARPAPASAPDRANTRASKSQEGPIVRKAWKPEEDAALAAAWSAGAALDALATRFGRSKRAIEARLVVVGATRDRAEARRRRPA